MIMGYNHGGTIQPGTPAAPESSYWDTARQAFAQNQTPWGPWTQGNYDAYQTVYNQNLNEFTSQFENLVGRAPTPEETGKFVNNYIVPNTRSLTDPTSIYRQRPDAQVGQFVGQNYRQTAKDYALEQLKGQQAEATRLSDLFRTQGRQSISGVEQSLLDYQSKLFDRLRPNLLTSLKAQGLLDTGGMNEAIAGQQGDMANEAARYIADLNYQNDQAANQIAFSGEAAPYYYRQGLITQQPQDLFNAGQNALNFNNNVYMQNLDYAHKLGFLNASQPKGSSFLNTLGQGFAQNFGSQLGQNLGNFIIPNYTSTSTNSATGKGSQSTGISAFLAG